MAFMDLIPVVLFDHFTTYRDIRSNNKKKKKRKKNNIFYGMSITESEYMTATKSHDQTK